MDRLTTKLDDGNYIPTALCTTDRVGNVDDLDGCTEYCDYCDGECSKCAIQKCFNKLAEYENSEDRLNGISIKQVIDAFIETVEVQTHEGYEHGRILTNAEADKWNEYKNAEEQGLLLRLPCKVGDTIYVNGVLGVGEAEEYKVIRVDYHSNLATNRSEFYIEALLVSDPRNSIGFYDKEFGKNVFLTQEEAEQKLKEMSEHDGE